MLDDAGYGDVDGFGRKTALTPNLKKMAEEGVRFTRHYADATCRPARLSLMTGKQASRVAMVPDFRGISPELEILPEKLKKVGYSTHHIGKWHLGDTTKQAWPSAQGFDSWQGFLNQFLLKGPSKRKKSPYRRPTYNNPWLQINDDEPKQFKGHLTDILADMVVKKIYSLKEEPSAKTKQPWFINYWMLAPHNPAKPSNEYGKQFPETPSGQYQALLKQMDASIGRVFEALEKTGQAENTLVVVVSDNGGTNERTENNFPFSGKKGVFSEGSLRTPLLIRWPNVLPKGKSYDGISAIYDLYPTLLSAANVHSSEWMGDNKIDGVDLFPLLLNDKQRLPQSMFWEMGSPFVYLYSMLD